MVFRGEGGYKKNKKKKKREDCLPYTRTSESAADRKLRPGGGGPRARISRVIGTPPGRTVRIFNIIYYYGNRNVKAVRKESGTALRILINIPVTIS